MSKVLGNMSTQARTVSRTTSYYMQVVPPRLGFSIPCWLFYPSIIAETYAYYYFTKRLLLPSKSTKFKIIKFTKPVHMCHHL